MGVGMFGCCRSALMYGCRDVGMQSVALGNKLTKPLHFDEWFTY